MDSKPCARAVNGAKMSGMLPRLARVIRLLSCDGTASSAISADMSASSLEYLRPDFLLFLDLGFLGESVENY